MSIRNSTTPSTPHITARLPGRLTARLPGRLTARSVRIHALLVGLAFIALGIANAVLNNSYARSLFPVSYAEGQTTFDGDRIKDFYQFMADRGTLNIYWQTQFIDFAFIAAMATLGLTAGSFVARLHRPGSALARIALAAGWLIVGGAAFDAVENLFSFVMLAQPESFPNWLAIPYSSAAVIKFALIGIGMATLVISFAALIVRTIARLVRIARPDRAQQQNQCLQGA